MTRFSDLVAQDQRLRILQLLDHGRHEHLLQK